MIVVTCKFCSHRLQIEAERWLSDRNRYGAIAQCRRSQIKRWTLLLPSVSVLFLLLFWTPVQAAIIRLHNFTPGDLAGCRFSIPLSWMPHPLWTHERGGHRLELVKFGHIARTALTLCYKPPIVSDIALTVSSGPQPNQDINELMEEDRRNTAEFRIHPFPAAALPTTCWEYKRKGHTYYPEGDFWLATCVAND